MDFFLEWGYFGQFTVSFLAATLLPLGSEALLVLLLLNAYDPVMVIATATLGNVLGSTVNYGLGLWGGGPLIQRILGISPGQLEAARRRFSRLGVLSLLLAWVPVIGDPLTVMAGLMRINAWTFLFLVTMGKLGRYLFVALAAWPAV